MQQKIKGIIGERYIFHIEKIYSDQSIEIMEYNLKDIIEILYFIKSKYHRSFGDILFISRF